ncbi:uncharacterized protein BP5553_03647 [Venustampulla echinocandica]|uniref:Store-operated calcium entry-associated regulatory factor n=1 Tax=Venustampulla echinocandica TaxID=2656787 RepID=A0A370TUU3_9HELO|nr:uncharacterized protein BP5553_03647 [Venustampulla echinocandica]RDL39307.1 hypothetical protein BP5553_03647 [Venustampulla echinocandica]
MQLYHLIYPALLALLAAPSQCASKKPPKNAILLSNVKSLTLRADAKTAHRRVSAIQQLSCKGPGCKYFTVDVMRCTNQGADYSAEDIQWSCTANIPEEFKLGSTDVICEGYANRDDDFVLKGSCGVEYRLLLTEKGEEKYGRKTSFDFGDKGGRSWGSNLFMLVWVLMLSFIVLIWLYRCVYGDVPAVPRARRRPGGFWGGGWGGGGPGGGGPFDPPPPYTPYSRKSSSRAGADEAWRPGFWSGALGGAAAGYIAGNRGQAQQQPVQRDNSWFGGGSGGSNWRSSPHRPSGSSSSSSARHESTGFGSTSRR